MSIGYLDLPGGADVSLWELNLSTWEWDNVSPPPDDSISEKFIEWLISFKHF